MTRRRKTPAATPEPRRESNIDQVKVVDDDLAVAHPALKAESERLAAEGVPIDEWVGRLSAFAVSRGWLDVRFASDVRFFVKFLTRRAAVGDPFKWGTAEDRAKRGPAYLEHLWSGLPHSPGNAIRRGDS